ncbi:site-specific integrase [Haloarcula amylolytica]|nr:site-specific integrase [Haloarcula amylolytica]
MYLDERKEDATYSTWDTIDRGLRPFSDWSEEVSLENMNELTGRKLRQFKSWCRETTGNGIVSLNGIFGVLRRFLVYCTKIEAVPVGLPPKTPVPNVPDDKDISYAKPSDELVNAVSEYLEVNEPSSRRRVEFEIIKEIASRVGAVRAIDLKDLKLDERVIKFRHRPADSFDIKGTPLKNGSDGERNVNISDELAELIRSYLNSPDRHDVTDKFGREPLLTTPSGRPTVDTIRRDLYKLTRPCEHSNECPHDREIESCEAYHNHHASECPSSHSPHPLRRWSIEYQIDRGVAKELLCDRVDVSVPVLNKHYDTRSKERQQKHRLKTYAKLFEGYGRDAETLTTEELVDVISDDNGMIDPQAVMQLAQSDSADDNTDENPGERENGDDPERNKNQTSLESFGVGPNAFAHPAAVPVVSAVSLGAWIPNRLQRELQDIAPDSEPSPVPDPTRAVKGAAGYSLCIVLLAFNLAMMGLVPA